MKQYIHSQNPLISPVILKSPLNSEEINENERERIIFGNSFFKFFPKTR